MMSPCVHYTATTPDTSCIQSTNKEMRAKPSGRPLAHGFGYPQDTKPINCPFEANGPPESPIHPPMPLRSPSVQSVPLKIPLWYGFGISS